jgi:hypothetical protein
MPPGVASGSLSTAFVRVGSRGVMNKAPAPTPFPHKKATGKLLHKGAAVKKHSHKAEIHFWSAIGVVICLLCCFMATAFYLRFRVKQKGKKASAYSHALVGDDDSGSDDEFDELLPAPHANPRSDSNKWSKVESK